jgi:hypothetical protein
MTVTETLLELEDQMWRANREGDGSFYAHWLRDDALAVSKYGIIDKAAAVPGIQANHNPYLKTPRTRRSSSSTTTPRSSPTASR